MYILKHEWEKVLLSSANVYNTDQGFIRTQLLGGKLAMCIIYQSDFGKEVYFIIYVIFAWMALEKKFKKKDFIIIISIVIIIHN